MTESRRLRGRLDHAKLVRRDRAEASRTVVAEWEPERDERRSELDNAWKDWLAAERARRGNPRWMP